MTSGKLTPKADDALRKKLSKRAEDHIALVNKMIPDKFLKSPSQKKSELARKRELRRAGLYTDACIKAASDLILDCHTCPKFPCGSDPQVCDEQMILGRCSVCGKAVRYYVDDDVKWNKCPRCREVVK